MLALRTTLPFALLAVLPAFAQETSRSFHLDWVPQVPALREIGVMLRLVSGTQNITVDEAASDVTVHGSETDIATAAWVLEQLKTQGSTPVEYPVPGTTDAVHVIKLLNAVSQPEVNETVTSLRVNCDLQRIFTYTPQRVIVFRSSAERAAMGAWLVQQLDIKADDPNRFNVHEYPSPLKGGEVLKVMFLRYPAPQAGLNELVTTVRVVADVQKIFTHSGEPRGIAFYSDIPHARTAEWLIQQLDVQPDASTRAAAHDLEVPFAAGEIARVFFLDPGDTHQKMNEMVTQIRNATGSPRMFVCSGKAALALRGTPEVIAAAERVLKNAQ